MYTWILWVNIYFTMHGDYTAWPVTYCKKGTKEKVGYYIDDELQHFQHLHQIKLHQMKVQMEERQHKGNAYEQIQKHQFVHPKSQTQQITTSFVNDAMNNFR